jgi:S1/P1 Nuclease
MQLFSTFASNSAFLMRTSIGKLAVLLILFFYLPGRCLAWGTNGHRIVAEIAYSYLTPKARAEVAKILGNESMAIASNWPDFIKSDTAYRYLNSWHYIDFDKPYDYAAMKAFLSADTSADAYVKLNWLIAQLKKKNLSADKKKMYLRLVIHIVGDLHQPLHVSPSGDAGGNDIKISWFNQPSNLHRLWDEQLIEYQQLSYTEYVKAINFTTQAQRNAWQKQPVTQWVFDSYIISRRLHDELNQPNPKLSYEYNFRHVQTLNDQLLKGGVHLAGLLNQLFS